MDYFRNVLINAEMRQVKIKPISQRVSKTDPASVATNPFSHLESFSGQKLEMSKVL